MSSNAAQRACSPVSFIASTEQSPHRLLAGRMAFFVIHCRLKAYRLLYDFWGRKINLSGISPAKPSQSGPNLVYVDMPRGDNVQVILGAIGPLWAKWGLGQVPQSAMSLFCLVNHARDLRQFRDGRFSPNLVTKRFSVSCCGIRKDILENFHFVICP